jgi:hypothetical protein
LLLPSIGAERLPVGRASQDLFEHVFEQENSPSLSGHHSPPQPWESRGRRGFLVDRLRYTGVFSLNCPVAAAQFG